MRIAFTFLTYGTNIFGGIENALFNLTKGLKDIGHEVSVFTSSTYLSTNGNLPANVYQSKHLPTKYDGNVNRLISYLQDHSKLINSDLDSFLEKCKPDHVVVVDPIWGILEATAYINRRNIPISMSYHIANDWPETRPIMERSLLNQYANFFVVSRFLETEIKGKFNVARDVKMKILPNSIDTSLYSDPSSIPEEYIFCNSRIAEGKNVDVLVNAFSTIKDDGLELVLCTGKFPFGDSANVVNKMERLVKELRIENQVKFLPNINWVDVPAMVKKSYAVVLPSTYETFGIAALEASVAGVPLIVADATNFKNLVKRNALFFTPNAIEDLSKKIRTLRRNYKYYRDKSSKDKVHFINNFDNIVVAERLVNEIHSNNV